MLRFLDLWLFCRKRLATVTRFIVPPKYASEYALFVSYDLINIHINIR